MAPKFSGIYPPVITPFTEKGQIDYVAIDENIARWNETGLSGYVVFGSNGESIHLNDEEKITIVSQFANGAVGKQLIAGTGQQSTSATIELTTACAKSGADAALIINPSFYRLSNDELISHYSTIADASPIPILIYNVPKFTGANIESSVVIELSSDPNIVGIKDSSGDVGQISAVIAATPNDFSVLSGTINVMHAACVMGASGAVTALANIAPEECVHLFSLSVGGNTSEARTLQQRLIPPNVAITKTFGISGLKAAMEMTGYTGGWPRLPLKPLDEEPQRILAEILKKAELL